MPLTVVTLDIYMNKLQASISIFCLYTIKEIPSLGESTICTCLAANQPHFQKTGSNMIVQALELFLQSNLADILITDIG